MKDRIVNTLGAFMGIAFIGCAIMVFAWAVDRPRNHENSDAGEPVQKWLVCWDSPAIPDAGAFTVCTTMWPTDPKATFKIPGDRYHVLHVTPLPLEKP